MLFPSVGGYMIKNTEATNFPIVPMAAISYSRPILIKFIRNSE